MEFEARLRVASGAAPDATQEDSEDNLFYHGWNKKLFDLYKTVEILNENPLFFKVVS